MRLLVILRDPTERAYSHYSMTADKTSTAVLMDRRKVVAGKSFEELVDVDMALLAEAILCLPEKRRVPTRWGVSPGGAPVRR